MNKATKISLNSQKLLYTATNMNCSIKEKKHVLLQFPIIRSMGDISNRAKFRKWDTDEFTRFRLWKNPHEIGVIFISISVGISLLCHALVSSFAHCLEQYLSHKQQTSYKIYIKKILDLLNLRMFSWKFPELCHFLYCFLSMFISKTICWINTEIGTDSSLNKSTWPIGFQNFILKIFGVI